MSDNPAGQPKRPTVQRIVMRTLSLRPDGSWRVVKEVVVKDD